MKIVIWFVWFILFIWLNETNRINKTNQINQMNQTDRAWAGRSYAASASKVRVTWKWASSTSGARLRAS